jgi:hypothetical protein
LTPCHVTEINYVDRGVAARTPLQIRMYDVRGAAWHSASLLPSSLGFCFF